VRRNCSVGLSGDEDARVVQPYVVNRTIDPLFRNAVEVTGTGIVIGSCTALCLDAVHGEPPQARPRHGGCSSGGRRSAEGKIMSDQMASTFSNELLRRPAFPSGSSARPGGHASGRRAPAPGNARRPLRGTCPRAMRGAFARTPATAGPQAVQCASPDGALAFAVFPGSRGLVVQRTELRPADKLRVESWLFADASAFAKWCESDALRFAYPLLFVNLARCGRDVFARAG
jgi:hypothetical protein